MGNGCSDEGHSNNAAVSGKYDLRGSPTGTGGVASPPVVNNATTLLETEAARLEQPGTQQQRRLNPQQLEKLKTASLKQSIFGECLTLEQLQYLAAQAEMKKWSIVGDRICEQGAKADTMYVVHKGEVLLEVQDEALDNRANQLQVARIMAEQDLVPLTAGEAAGHKVPKSPGGAQRTVAPSPKASPKHAKAAQSTTLHPASIAHPAQIHTAQRGSPIAAGRTTNSGIPLTRAELIAIEAAARIEQESNEVAGGTTTAGPARSPESSPDFEPIPSPQFGTAAAGPDSANSFLAPPPSLENVEEFERYTEALPETYTETQKMFMCVKTPTQCFGVGMFFAPGQRYMYTVLNNSLSTHLICLPRKGFEMLWTKWPDVRQPLMKHLGEYLEDSLTVSNWLSDATIVDRTKLTLLTSMFHHATVEAGTRLFEEGDICSDDSPLYFILSGSVELTFTNEKGHKLTKVLTKGATFGELGVLLGFSITASAATLENCTFRLCKRRWLNLFAMMTPLLLPTLRANLQKNYHVRDEQMLENLPVQTLFTEFCLKEYNAENVEFWTVAIRFRKVVFPNHCHQLEDVLAEAAMIYNRYISETSVLQINIKQSIRSTIKSSLQQGEVHKDLFLAAEREICQLMLQDTFTRFKVTPLYAQALSMLHAPAPLPILLNHTNTASLAPAIRAKEYSRTGEGSGGVKPAGGAAAKVSPDGLPGGGRKLGVTLDDTVEDVSRPLMFGGGAKNRGAPLTGPAAAAVAAAAAAQSAAAARGSIGASGLGVQVTDEQQQQQQQQASADGVDARVVATGIVVTGESSIGTSALGISSAGGDITATPQHDALTSPHHLLPAAAASHSLQLSSDGTDQFRLHNEVDGGDISPETRAPTTLSAAAAAAAGADPFSGTTPTVGPLSSHRASVSKGGDANVSMSLDQTQQAEDDTTKPAQPKTDALAVPKSKPKVNPPQPERGTPANLPKQKLQPPKRAPQQAEGV